MSGRITLSHEPNGGYRFHLLAQDGRILASSPVFDTKREAVVGIYEARECAGTALITDLSAGAHDLAMENSQPFPRRE